jgi:hypothetical protein
MLIETFSGLDATTFLAYLDPGLGSMQLQIIVAGLLSFGFFVKTHLVQVKYRIGRILKKRND